MRGGFSKRVSSPEGFRKSLFFQIKSSGGVLGILKGSSRVF